MLLYDMQNYIQSQKQVQIVGEIRNYEKKSNSAGYLLCDCTVKQAESEAVCERLYMLFEAQDLPIGSVVQILGTLKVPEAPGNPGQFDAKSYYETKKKHYRCSHTVNVLRCCFAKSGGALCHHLCY